MAKKKSYLVDESRNGHRIRAWTSTLSNTVEIWDSPDAVGDPKFSMTCPKTMRLDLEACIEKALYTFCNADPN